MPLTSGIIKRLIRFIRNKYKGAEEYEFEIHAYDGRILSFDQDR